MNDKDKYLENHFSTESASLIEQNDKISAVEQIASTADSIEVMTHFRASLQRNRRLGELLAQ
ncbi:MAG: hypothetical protein R3E08_11630 [Thiotrichaceae bacterium]